MVGKQGMVEGSTGEYFLKLKSLFVETFTSTGRHQTRSVVRSAPPTGARGKTFIEKMHKQSKEII